jgi:hypothetical protein
MVNEKSVCAKCAMRDPIASTSICAVCLRADAVGVMLTAWSCLRPAEREQFLRRACIRRFAA